MIAGIILAAGLSRRMGRQKLLLELQGKAVVRWAVEGVVPHVGDRSWSRGMTTRRCVRRWSG